MNKLLSVYMALSKYRSMVMLAIAVISVVMLDPEGPPADWD